MRRLFFVMMVVLWAALIVLAVASPSTLWHIWDWVRAQTAALEVVLWIVFLPWLLGLAVWQADITAWIRWPVLLLLAAGWVLLSLPRKT